MLADSAVARLIGRAGFDWACVDLQHGLADEAAAAAMLPALAADGTAPFARVASNDAARIGRALDLGAIGIVVPLVESAEAARAAARACRYPPLGERSFGAIRRVIDGADTAPAAAEADVRCVVMVETAEGLARAAEIAATDGVDAVFVGPNDLALSLGCHGGGSRQPRIEEAIGTVVEACRAAGKVAGLYCDAPEDAPHWVAAGVRLLSVHSDSKAVLEGTVQGLDAARGPAP